MDTNVSNCCPFCGSPRNPEAEDFDCPVCGLPGAFLLNFSDASALETWQSRLRRAEEGFAHRLGTGRLTAGGRILGYLCPDTRELYLMGPEHSLIREENVVSFSACDRQLALCYGVVIG